MKITYEQLKTLYDCMDKLIDPTLNEDEYDDARTQAVTISTEISESNGLTNDMHLYERMEVYVNNDVTFEEVLEIFEEDLVNELK